MFNFIGTLIKRTFQIVGAICILFVGFVFFYDSTDTNKVSKASTTIEKKIEEPKVEVVKVEVPTLTLVEKAHKQKLDNPRMFSTHLPHVGKLKGDDLRNCFNNRFWDITTSDADVYKINLGMMDPDILNGPDGQKALDFCAWHARTGKYQ